MSKQHEGIIEIDTGGGLPLDFAVRMLRGRKVSGVIPPSIFTQPDKRLVFASFTCAHCHAIVMLSERAARTERPKCHWGCAKYLCSECGVTAAHTKHCVNRNHQIERALEKFALQLQRSSYSGLIII